MLRNPLMQRVIKNSSYLFSGTTISAALSMLQGILAARLLVQNSGAEAGVAAYGLLGTITAFASVVNRLTSSRMGELVVNFTGEYAKKGQDQYAAATYKAASLAEALSSILAFTLIVILAPLAARIFTGDPTLATLFILYGSMVLANLVAESSLGLLQTFNEFRLIAAVSVAQSVLTLALILLAYVMNGGLVAILLAYWAGKIAWAFGISGAAFWHAGVNWGAGWWKSPLSLLTGRWREMFRFGISTNLTGTITLITRDSEVLWLGALSSPLQVGYYKVTLAIINILILPIQPLISTTYREFAREVADKAWQNVRYLLRSGSLIASAYAIPAAIGLVILSPVIISLYGTGFLPTSYHCLLILLVGVTFVSIFYWNRTTLLPLGIPEYPTKVTLVAAILKIGLTLLLIPTYGAIGMAVLLSAYFLLTAAVLVWKTYREIRVQEAATPAYVGN